jgi:hypothetical protein
MNTSIRGECVRFDDRYLHVDLVDGRIISTQIEWCKELQNASFREVLNYRFICGDSGIEWPDLDYHLSIESMLSTASEALAA